MVELASDFLDRNTPIFRDDVVFFISQSGIYFLKGYNLEVLLHTLYCMAIVFVYLKYCPSN